MIPTPTTELADLAEECLCIEQQVAGQGMMQTLARGATRDLLAAHALEFGFAPAEIDAAVDAALKAATSRKSATT